MLIRLVVQVLTAIATAGPLLSCPIEKIAHVTREPLGEFKKIEVDARKWRSLEGGVWKVHLRQDGVPHSIVRIDYGETGQRQVRASFVDKHAFGLVVTSLRYDAPISADRAVKVVERTSTEFFFCGSHVGLLQAKPKDDANTLAAIRGAQGEKSMLFASQEIAPYLERLK
jgi:hypothetical protein